MNETSASVGKGWSVSNVARKGGARSSKNQLRAPRIPCPWACGLEASRFVRSVAAVWVGPMGARKGSGLRDRLLTLVSRNGCPGSTKTWIESTRELDGRACEGRRRTVRGAGLPSKGSDKGRAARLTPPDENQRSPSPKQRPKLNVEPVEYGQPGCAGQTMGGDRSQRPEAWTRQDRHPATVSARAAASASASTGRHKK